MPRTTRCPCGSGKLRDRCDPAPLVWCCETGCPNRFHQHSNRHARCTTHALERERYMERERGRRRRAARKAAA